MRIEICTRDHLETWATFRHALWPTEDRADLRAQAEAILGEERDDLRAFVAVTPEGAVAGFAEASLRYDYVNGCETSPVAFLEGIFVDPQRRRQGVARALTTAVEAWARERGCEEFASDALLDNTASHNMHNALGFQETERVVYFKKTL